MSKVVRLALLTGFLTFIIYPLSYAPIFRALEGTRRSTIPDRLRTGSLWEWTYRPVTTLIDETPIRTPLLSWSELWGVGSQHRSDSIERKLGIEPL